jgi:biotin transport system substrate-specific component
MIQQNQTTSLSGKRRAIVRTALTAMFAALTAAGTFITIPLPLVPLVLQNLFALLSGLILGPLLGGCAVGLFLIAGAIGAPVFAGGSGGFAHFFGPTGGYLIGYLLAAVVAGFIAGRPRTAYQTPIWRIILGAVLGLLAVYVPGVIQLKIIIQGTWAQALAAGFLPFLIGDGIKAVVAVILCPRLRRLAADQLES